MLKIGLVGCGGMGTMHSSCYQELKDYAAVAAVSDVNPDTAKTIADRFGAAVFATADELIAHADIDAVDICLPTYLHTQYILQAMKRNLAVMVEKPVCINEEEAQLLLQTQKETGSQVMVGHVMRYWDEYAWLKRVFDTKQYGAIESASFKRACARPRQKWWGKQEFSGGDPLDLHIHDVDYIRYLLGEPEKITTAAARDDQGQIRHIFSTFEYGNVVAAAEGCGDYPEGFPFMMNFIVKFEQATAVFNSSAVPALVVYTKSDGKIIPPIEHALNNKLDHNLNGQLNITDMSAYYNELKYFVKSLADGTPFAISPLTEAIRSARLVWQEIRLCRMEPPVRPEA
ncbi:MAG: Gfo/Idh/MocA family oxidoreductase [Clostridiaceae bacterium]|nr:Gfo/Idh/MocA family oxidoreductase [Clostridiaceae bacterium]